MHFMHISYTQYNDGRGYFEKCIHVFWSLITIKTILDPFQFHCMVSSSKYHGYASTSHLLKSGDNTNYVPTFIYCMCFSTI